MSAFSFVIAERVADAGRKALEKKAKEAEAAAIAAEERRLKAMDGVGDDDYNGDIVLRPLPPEDRHLAARASKATRRHGDKLMVRRCRLILG